MKNILSYTSRCSFTGEEILSWAYAREGKNWQARRIIKRYPNLVPDREYEVSLFHFDGHGHQNQDSGFRRALPHIKRTS